MINLRLVESIKKQRTQNFSSSEVSTNSFFLVYLIPINFRIPLIFVQGRTKIRGNEISKTLP